MIEPRKITLSSMDVSAEKRERLKELFPEVFSEDNIDYDQLKRVLGEWVEPQNERFGLNWLGKAECMKIIQEPSLAMLKPVRDESVNFDDTENLFIEGDNLEVLKLLQKSYFGKVKMIYIDPPYNTGKEFIYPDKYAMALDTYLAYTGQIDEYKRKFSTNTDTVGRYHSNWLNMMYPRLYLAKNLLRNDGVIFISIDDNEFAHLRELCDMIFGAENFVAAINREVIKGGSQSTFLRVCHDYVLIYAKNISELSFSGHEKNPISLDLKDEKGAYAKGRELNKWGAGSRREDSPSMWFPIPGPNGEEVFPIRNDGSEGRWRLGKQKLLALVDSGDIIFEKRDDGTYIAYEMIRFTEPKIKQFTTIFKDKYINAKGTERIKSIFNMQRSYFDYAKPSELIFDFLVMADVRDGDLVLDFFAGSSTTADAVMQFSATRDQQVNFLMVQLPEPTEENSIAYQNGYKTISDIAKERIRRAANTIATGGGGGARALRSD